MAFRLETQRSCLLKRSRILVSGWTILYLCPNMSPNLHPPTTLPIQHLAYQEISIQERLRNSHHALVVYRLDYCNSLFSAILPNFSHNSNVSKTVQLDSSTSQRGILHHLLLSNTWCFQKRLKTHLFTKAFDTWYILLFLQINGQIFM